MLVVIDYLKKDRINLRIVLKKISAEIKNPNEKNNQQRNMASPKVICIYSSFIFFGTYNSHTFIFNTFAITDTV